MREAARAAIAGLMLATLVTVGAAAAGCAGGGTADSAPAPTLTVGPVPPATLPTAAPAVSGALVLDGAHDLVFDGVVFRGAGSGWGDASGLIYIQGSSHNITFENCVIGTNQDGVGNGVKIVDTGAGMYDITFKNCTFKYQPRMGFECIGREQKGTIGYQRINVIDCTFEPGAGEAISYDDENGTAGDCTVSGNLVKGGGVGDLYQYGMVFEINGTRKMTVTENTFASGRDGIMNLRGDRRGQPVQWMFSGNVVDGARVAAGVKPRGSQLYVCNDVHGDVTFADRIVSPADDPSEPWGYFSGCAGLDFSTSTVSGATPVPPPDYRKDCTAILWPRAAR